MGHSANNDGRVVAGRPAGEEVARVLDLGTVGGGGNAAAANGEVH